MSDNQAAVSPVSSVAEDRRARVLFWVVLAISALYLLGYSHWKAIWGDEVLTYFTVDHTSLGDLLHFQRTTPIVLEPPFFDSTLWGASKVFGLSPQLLRVPGLLSFLGMQAFVFSLLRRFSLRAAYLGVLIFLPFSIVSFGPEIRPYGFLMLCAAALLWFWQRASEDSAGAALALFGLAATAAAATTSQFYGVLLVLPVVVGELVRTLRGGRRNVRVWLALVVVVPAVGMDVPFLHAVKPYQQLLNLQTSFGFRTFADTYLLLLKSDMHMRGAAMTAAVRAIVIVLLIGSCVLSFPRRQNLREDAMEAGLLPLWAALCSLAVLPALVLAIASFVTHTYAPRHAIGCAVGFFSLAAIAISQLVASAPASARTLAMVLVLVFLAAAGLYSLRNRRLAMAGTLVANRPNSAAAAELRAKPDEHLYLTIDLCLVQVFYGDPEFLSRERCLYSRAKESQYSHQVIGALTMRALEDHTRFPLQASTYEAFREQGKGLFVYHDDPWVRWVPESLAADQAQREPLGVGFGGDLQRVVFPGR